MFYNPRLDTAEEARLYTDYRSETVSPNAARLRALVHGKLQCGPCFRGFLTNSAVPHWPRILHRHLGTRKIGRVLGLRRRSWRFLVCGLIDGAAAFVDDI